MAHRASSVLGLFLCATDFIHSATAITSPSRSFAAIGSRTSPRARSNSLTGKKHVRRWPRGERLLHPFPFAGLHWLFCSFHSGCPLAIYTERFMRRPHLRPE